MASRSKLTVAKGAILLIGGISSVYVSVNYYRAWKGPELQPHPKDYCIQCHSDEKTLRMMKMKAGDDETDPHFNVSISGAKLDAKKKPAVPLD